jgi:hypothetical protein
MRVGICQHHMNHPSPFTMGKYHRGEQQIGDTRAIPMYVRNIPWPALPSQAGRLRARRLRGRL